MRADLLDVVAVYSNPIRWQSRLRLHKEFEQHMLDSGVKLTVVECAYGERPFELEDSPHVNRVRVRAKTLVWNKENCLNLGIARTEGRFICWCDADVTFRRPGWATETVHALQHYDVVQPWSDAYDLGPHDEHIQHHHSFCRQYWHKQPVVPAGEKFWSFNGGPYTYPHSGYAWAATRQALEWVGGLFDLGAMGAGDHHMALALVGAAEKSVPAGVTDSYLWHLQRWQQKARYHINGNIGFVWGTLEHSFHGSKEKRKYVDRWGMIVDHKFDPDTDLKRNTHGVYELAGNKPGLQHDLDMYFRQRDEDDNSL